MRMMAKIEIPVEIGTRTIANGELPKVIQQTAERWKPEAMYFTTFNGKRTALIVFDMPDSSAIPQFAEPLFEVLHADIQFAPAMNAEDLQRGLSPA